MNHEEILKSHSLDDGVDKGRFSINSSFLVRFLGRYKVKISYFCVICCLFSCGFLIVNSRHTSAFFQWGVASIVMFFYIFVFGYEKMPLFYIYLNKNSFSFTFKKSTILRTLVSKWGTAITDSVAHFFVWWSLEQMGISKKIIQLHLDLKEYPTLPFSLYIAIDYVVSDHL